MDDVSRGRARFFTNWGLFVMVTLAVSVVACFSFAGVRVRLLSPWQGQLSPPNPRMAELLRQSREFEESETQVAESSGQLSFRMRLYAPSGPELFPISVPAAPSCELTSDDSAIGLRVICQMHLCRVTSPNPQGKRDNYDSGGMIVVTDSAQMGGGAEGNKFSIQFRLLGSRSPEDVTVMTSTDEGFGRRLRQFALSSDTPLTDDNAQRTIEELLSRCYDEDNPQALQQLARALVRRILASEHLANSPLAL